MTPTPPAHIVFPYGIADFEAIRREGMFFVDRTAKIHDLERLGRTLVFLRPRRFGKSLLLRTLASYYDLRLAEDFELLFGDLDIGHEPTPNRNRYFVLNWNFSVVPPGRTLEKVEENLANHVRSRAKVFASRYAEHLPSPIRADGPAGVVLDELLGAVSQTPYKLYLLIDEYDNFINEIMATDAKLYQALVETGGPFKQLFKSVKEAGEGQGLERAFVTGVSPVALNDITSGFNNAKDLSHRSTLATLCGFREAEIRGVLERIAARQDLSPRRIEEHLEILRIWYNGYRFTSDDSADELVYNPTSVLYFLEYLDQEGTPPPDLHDQNLRTDRGKIAFIAKSSVGSGIVEELSEGDGTIAISELKTVFSLEDLVERIRKDPATVTSFLYYLGILTHSSAHPKRLRIPNLVVRKLFLDHLLEIFLPDYEDSSQVRKLVTGFFDDGDLRRLLLFFEHRLLPVLSNRDRGAAPKEPWQSGGGVNEMVIKALFLSILFDDQRYLIFSELEARRGYADLCLLVRPELRTPSAIDLLFEFKLLRRKELGKKGQDLRNMDAEELRALPAVESAFSVASEQLARYREALVARFGGVPPKGGQRGGLNLRAYAVVAVDLERMLGEEILL